MAERYQFQSDHFKGNQQIQDCADVPMRHIKLGDSGPHVAKIQDALKQIREQGLKNPLMPAPPQIADDPDLKNKRYGKSTHDAVLKYKQDRSVINHSYQEKADPIVGQMTIRQLDEDMAFIEGRKRDDAQPTQDFFIDIEGDALGRGDDISETSAGFSEIVSAQKGYQEKHGKLKCITFHGGFGTNDPFNRIITKFKSESAGVKKFGRIIVSGTSIGGRNAMRVANRLALDGLSINLVALNDAAFDENDPMLNFPLQTTGERISWFQSWSFTIDPSREFHGSPTTFKPLDRIHLVRDIQRDYEADEKSRHIRKMSDSDKTAYVNSAHTRCCIQCHALEILPKIRSILAP